MVRQMSNGTVDKVGRKKPSQVASSASEQGLVIEKKRVAIVHDWLVGGGAELVIEQLHKMYPDAPIYTSYCSKLWRQRLDNKVVTGYLQKWPFSRLRRFLPLLRCWWFKRIDLNGYDLIISSSGNGEAKQITKPKDATHINYCHTPPHYLWSKYDQYLKSPGFGIFNPLPRVGLKLLLGPLRKKDLNSAKNVDYFIANSTHIQSEIKKYYQRDSTIIHPPVDTSRFSSPALSSQLSPKRGFVTIGRQVPYKRIDLIINACNELRLNLVVVGRGPEHKKLLGLAGSTIKFDDNASDEKVADYMANTEAFIFASEEDFGITPVEAMASGTPVIAFKAGGALDYVKEGKTGEFFDEQTKESLKRCLKNFNTNKFDSVTISSATLKFSSDNFRVQIKDFIKQL